MDYTKIWKKTLAPGEKVEYEFSVGKKYAKYSMTLGCLAGIALLFTLEYFVGVLVIIASVVYFNYFLKLTNAYAFTNKRVILYRGWIASNLISIDYTKITDVIVDQSVYGKITNSGNLIVNTAGELFKNLKEKQKIEYIDDPYEAKKKLDQIRSSVKA